MLKNDSALDDVNAEMQFNVFIVRDLAEGCDRIGVFFQTCTVSLVPRIDCWMRFM